MLVPGTVGGHCAAPVEIRAPGRTDPVVARTGGQPAVVSGAAARNWPAVRNLPPAAGVRHTAFPRHHTDRRLDPWYCMRLPSAAAVADRLVAGMLLAVGPFAAAVPVAAASFAVAPSAAGPSVVAPSVVEPAVAGVAE